MTDRHPSAAKEAILEELLTVVKVNIHVAGGWGSCPAAPSFYGHWLGMDRDCTERVKRAAAALKHSASQGDAVFAATGKEALIQELLNAIEANTPIATGTGRCPAVPCFDHHDSEAESSRPGWEVVEQNSADRIKKAATALETNSDAFVNC